LEHKKRRPVWDSVFENWLIESFAYSEGFVFFRPTTRSPSFHSPRFLSKSTRSKRLSTLRFTAELLDDL
jgi:hypothetical protein